MLKDIYILRWTDTYIYAKRYIYIKLDGLKYLPGQRARFSHYVSLWDYKCGGLEEVLGGFAN